MVLDILRGGMASGLEQLNIILSYYPVSHIRSAPSRSGGRLPMSARGTGGAARFGLVRYSLEFRCQNAGLGGLCIFGFADFMFGSNRHSCRLSPGVCGRSSRRVDWDGHGANGHAANIGYGFLWEAFYEWRYPSVVYLSETRVVFDHYANYQEREIAFLVGPEIIAGIFATGSWQACRWWNNLRTTCPPN